MLSILWLAVAVRALYIHFSAGGPALPILPTAGATNRKETNMRDQLFDRDYQNGRDALHHGIDALLAYVLAGFRTLQANQFSAPWKPRSNRPSAV